MFVCESITASKASFKGRKRLKKIHPPQNKISYPNPKETQNKVLSFGQSKPISVYCITFELPSIEPGGNKTLNYSNPKIAEK